MADDKKHVEDRLLIYLFRLDAKVTGLVAGLVAGLGLFLVTNWLILKGGEVVGPHLALLGQVFIGYRVTFVGSLIGFGYAFVSGFCLGYLVAVIYNRLVRLREVRRVAPGEGTRS